MAIKAAIFDFGGVIVRTEDWSGRMRWEERLGLSQGDLPRLVFNSETALQASLGNVPEEVIWEHLGAKLHLDVRDLTDLRNDFWSGDRLDPELVEFIRSLRPKLKTAILSNAWSGARTMFSQTFRLHEVVDLIVISAEEGIAKPDPEIYHRIALRLGVVPGEAVFVDDFIENVQAARRIGMEAILFESTDQVKDQITKLLNP